MRLYVIVSTNRTTGHTYIKDCCFDRRGMENELEYLKEQNKNSDYDINLYAFDCVQKLN